MSGLSHPNDQAVSSVLGINAISALYAEFCKRYPYLSDPQEAEGRCRWASFTFADLADRYGISVNLIRWRIVPTSRFAREDYDEHWAIDIGQGRILDPTSAQVAGLTSPWSRLNNYPSNYLMPKSVPAHALLPVYRRWVKQETGDSWSPDFIRRLNMLWERHTHKPSLLEKASSILPLAIFLLLLAVSLHHLLLA